MTLVISSRLKSVVHVSTMADSTLALEITKPGVSDEADNVLNESVALSAIDENDLGSLAIDESKEVHYFLVPEDCDIHAVTSGETPYTFRFEALNLSPELLKGIYVEMKFERPSKIQAIILSMILTPPYKNLIAQAHNGSEMSTCFVLGMLSRIDPKLGAPQALCICPTRELAIQNMEVLLKMGKFTGITTELGVPDKTDLLVAKRAPVTAQVIIGIPGTIHRWISASKLSTSQLKILVFDEAYHMLAEGGSKENSARIMKYIVKWSPKCQVLLFSATFSDKVKAFVSKFVNDLFVQEYNQFFVKKEELSLESIKQYNVTVPDDLSKIMVIKDTLLKIAAKVGQTIIFVRTRKSAGMLHEALPLNVDYYYPVTTIHAALTQEDRDKIVKEFKDGFTAVLISTDVLAREFDELQASLVINYDLPIVYDSPSEPDYEVYLHRVGRAGRFGRKGAVFNLLCGDKDRMIMEKIESHFNHYVTEVPSWTDDEQFKDALKKVGWLV